MTEENSMQSILENWGFSDLVPVFEEQGIKSLEILNVDREVVKELIPKIGRRLEFLKKLNDHCPQPSGSSVSSVNADSEISDISLLEIDFDNLDKDQSISNIDNSIETKSNGPVVFQKGLEDFLNRSFEGKVIIKNKNCLTNSLRSHLCGLIVNHLLIKYSDKVPQVVFLKVSEEIEKLFPGEIATIYFRPYRPKTDVIEKRQCGGKLWAKYTNMRRVMNQLSAFEKKGESDKENIPKISNEMKLHFEFVKYCTDINDNFINSWRESYSQRQQLLTSLSIDQYFEMFPALKLSKGYNFLISDFENKYKNQKNKLLENWTTIKKKLVILMEQKGSKDGRFRDEDINVAYNFPLLFQSSSIRNKKSKIFRYTKVETRDTFITHIGTLAEIDELRRKCFERAQQLSTTVQPFIIVCGKDDDINIINVYIAMNNTLYDIGNIVSAIDAAFKIHFALNLQFNVACAPIWTWLQTCVYEIQTEFDKQFGSVELFKAEFNKVVL